MLFFFSKFDTTTKVAPRHIKNTPKNHTHSRESQKISLEQGRLTIKRPPWNDTEFNILKQPLGGKPIHKNIAIRLGN